MNKRTLYLLSLLSGLLLAVSWPHTGGLTPLIFVAWIPLLIVEETVFSNPDQLRPLHLLQFSYITFFTWNLITTWWVWNASAGGAAMAVGCNALMMAMVFQIYHLAKKRLNGKFGPLILILAAVGSTLAFMGMLES